MAVDLATDHQTALRSQRTCVGVIGVVATMVTVISAFGTNSNNTFGFQALISRALAASWNLNSAVKGCVSFGHGAL
jgi:ABC-type branched-subunit amino acid transport system permease subunit